MKQKDCYKNVGSVMLIEGRESKGFLLCVYIQRNGEVSLSEDILSPVMCKNSLYTYGLGFEICTNSNLPKLRRDARYMYTFYQSQTELVRKPIRDKVGLSLP